MQLLSRYSIPDAYTLEELRREYLSEDAKGRIHLLARLLKQHVLPYEIARLAVEDQDVAVRQFIAKHGLLDWRDSKIVDHKRVYNDEHPERNLKEILKNDPDPFVRACLYENASFQSYGEQWEQIFKAATSIERLALVRNEQLLFEKNFILKIFDPEDQELGITTDERRELIFAFVTSRKVLARYTENAGLQGYPESWDGLTHWWSNEFLAKLWEIASKWPKESGVPRFVYEYVPANDEAKARIYETCKDRWLRETIITSCDPRESYVETIELAKKDPDENCRKWAEDDYHGEWKAEFESDERILLPTVRSDDQSPELESLEQKIILVGKKSLVLEEEVQSLNHQLKEIDRRITTLMFIAAVVGVVAIVGILF